VFELGNYKYGKKLETLPFPVIKQKVAAADLCWRDEAYFWLLYYTGVRKSEAYERSASDFKIKDQFLVIDFKRKKGSINVPPLELPHSWYGVDRIVKAVNHALKSPPKEKGIFVYENRTRVRALKKDRWVFPHIQSTKAWEIVQEVLGEEYYPHFLRLNRLTELASDPTANLTRLKSFSGLKTTSVLEGYLGTSKREQQKAIEYMNKKYT
jgi:integrase